MISTKSLITCHVVSIRGLPIATKRVPDAAAIDLTNPAKTNTCIAGTIGIHFTPKNIWVNSGANINIPPANGTEIKAVSCKVSRYASLSLFISFCNFEYAGNVT